MNRCRWRHSATRPSPGDPWLCGPGSRPGGHFDSRLPPANAVIQRRDSRLLPADLTATEAPPSHLRSAPGVVEGRRHKPPAAWRPSRKSSDLKLSRPCDSPLTSYRNLRCSLHLWHGCHLFDGHASPDSFTASPSTSKSRAVMRVTIARIGPELVLVNAAAQGRTSAISNELIGAPG